LVYTNTTKIYDGVQVHTCVGEHEKIKCVWANVVGLVGLLYPKGKFGTCLPNNKINVGHSTLVGGLDFF
jgi:hypothetical protein